MKKQPKCSACGRPIQFIRTKNGKMMPIEMGEFFIVPSKHGKVYCTVNGATVRGFEASEREPGRLYVHKPHWAYCPKSETKEQAAVEKARLERIAKAKALRALEEQERAEKLRLELKKKQMEEAQLCLFGGNMHNHR